LRSRTRIHQSVDVTAARLGWRFDERRFLNTGVLWVRDSPAAHAFFAEWHRRWQKAAATGVAFDQPAFNSCVADGLARVGVLPDSDNWMIWETPRFCGRARIFHFIASLSDGRPPEDTLLFRLMNGFQRTGQLDAISVERAARQNLPWTHGIGARRWLAAGHYLRAALAFARKRIGGGSSRA
jgi:hypothetical protein